MAELVDALDLGSSGATRESSSLSSRTIFKQYSLLSKSVVNCEEYTCKSVVENLGGLNVKKLEVTVPQEQIEEEVDKRIKEIAKKCQYKRIS